MDNERLTPYLRRRCLDLKVEDRVALVRIMTESLTQSVRTENQVDVLDPDLLDLGQHIYLVLLEYDEARLQDLWDHNEINFLIVRLAINNFRSAKSRFHYLFRVFRSRSVSLTGLDFPDNAQ